MSTLDTNAGRIFDLRANQCVPLLLASGSSFCSGFLFDCQLLRFWWHLKSRKQLYLSQGGHGLTGGLESQVSGTWRWWLSTDKQNTVLGECESLSSWWSDVHKCWISGLSVTRFSCALGPFSTSLSLSGHLCVFRAPNTGKTLCLVPDRIQGRQRKQLIKCWVCVHRCRLHICGSKPTTWGAQAEWRHWPAPWSCTMSSHCKEGGGWEGTLWTMELNSSEIVIMSLTMSDR